MRQLGSFLLFLGLGSGAYCASMASAQSKMDLDDITIKGELHNDDRLKLLARQKNELKNYVKYRTNYRKEIIEDLPKPRPRVKY